jgi:hypothetical protein
VAVHLVTAFACSALGAEGFPQNARFGVAGIHSLALHAALVTPATSPLATQSSPAAQVESAWVRPSVEVAIVRRPAHVELPTTKAPLQTPAPVHAVPAGQSTTLYVPFA